MESLRAEELASLNPGNLENEATWRAGVDSTLAALVKAQKAQSAR